MDDITETETTAKPTTCESTRRGEEAGEGPVLLSGTEHLLAALPHVLGYHPRRSVVLVATAPGARDAPHRRHAVLTARVDLPPGEDADVVLQAFAGPLARVAREQAGAGGGGAGRAGVPEGLDGLLLHVFVHDAPPQVADAVACAVWTLASAGGHGLHDLLLVEGERYLPLVADGVAGGRILRLVLGLDPADEVVAGTGGAGGAGGASRGADGTAADSAWGWRPVPVPADVPGVADLVLRGRSALPGRDDVVAGVRRHDPDAAAQTGSALDALRRGTDGSGRTRQHQLSALACLSRWVVDGEDEPDPAQRARVVLALSDRTLRDALLARWLPELFSVEEVLSAEDARDLRRSVRAWPARDAGALDRLLGVAAAVPRPVAAPLLTVAGVVAWGQGEGTVANETVDLALEIDPGYRMALLVQAALERGIPPWRRGAKAA
ncbi:DUF4192 family protein [Ornithinimicrobium avium]|uniref:DUF4192 family protein n=1 Tax=Ornithinimicrobium avium TaxID=2283195 RepID=A0A345NKX0_9MICO|nr:DUF4192 family protein [Ornithinimicrobium avium]AXH95678.1 DUF4192 family protein [Ornithinimicrobium avium]